MLCYEAPPPRMTHLYGIPYSKAHIANRRCSNPSGCPGNFAFTPAKEDGAFAYNACWQCHRRDIFLLSQHLYYFAGTQERIGEDVVAIRWRTHATVCFEGGEPEDMSLDELEILRQKLTLLA